ncbi:MAG: sigma 54-interacting transcriptional regulator, partial [Pirellulaceae bacterium]|nr:sigma 54-interacting transcriptional regulator [Pirellulaceae bacterium]
MSKATRNSTEAAASEAEVGAGRADDLLLRVWQEICRHVEITESTAAIVRLLREVTPLHRVLVRQIDRQRGVIETCADTALAESGEAAALRTAVSPDQVQRLEDAWREQRVRCWAPGEAGQGAAGCLLPTDAHAASAIVGLLTAPHGFLGVLILVAASGERFTPEHVALADMLLDPFTVAVENDQRLREVAALRAAAEADKQSLLNRLGRKDVTDSVVGADAGLREVMERVDLVTRSDVTVLLLGETGTGKEVIARVIHSHSARAGRAFLRVNCGAIPPELIDSELFGHERGAFTGATETRPGWF